jgi:mannose-6-phosphate isomerase-like protein (cupin superfamily)
MKMSENGGTSVRAGSQIPANDPQRALTLAQADSQKIAHLGVVGDTYTILLNGEDTNGRFCLMDMYVPPGGGPPPHRHDFEETFVLLEGELELTFRGSNSVALRQRDKKSFFWKLECRWRRGRRLRRSWIRMRRKNLRIR